MAATSCGRTRFGCGSRGRKERPWDRKFAGGMTTAAAPEPMRSAGVDSFTLFTVTVFSTRLFRVVVFITHLRRTIGGRRMAARMTLLGHVERVRGFWGSYPF